jgi:hypothetical protein
MLIAKKKCWAGSVKKWLFKHKPEEVAGSLPSVQLLLETTPQLATTRALQAPPLGFPHTMLSVRKVKHNMQLAFIKKLFTNREIEISV